jgi:hypothetical protein
VVTVIELNGTTKGYVSWWAVGSIFFQVSGIDRGTVDLSRAGWRIQRLPVVIGLPLALLCTNLPLLGQELSTQAALRELELYQVQLDTLEGQADFYDRQLLETLLGVAESSMALDLFEETDAVLDRAIQIVRVAEGLYTQAQFPFLHLSVRNDVRRGNWRDANDTLTHLRWLYTNKHRGLDDELIAELTQLSDLHLEGVIGDVYTNQSYHLRTADNINWAAVRVAERIWSPADPRLTDLYYRVVRHNFLQAMALNLGGNTATKLREAFVGQGWLRPRVEVERTYYSIGMDMIGRMRQVFALADPPDREAMAMALLYRADWQVVFAEDEPQQLYQQAYHELQAAGVSGSVLDQYFARPRLLPVDSFHRSVESAFASRSLVSGTPVSSTRAENDATVLRFSEWSSAFPNVTLPIAEPMLLQEEIDSRREVRLSVTLNGLERVSRWIRGRYVTQVSVADQFQPLSEAQSPSLSGDDLATRLHYLNFRPILREGIAQPFQGILEYRYFPPLPRD